MLKIFKLNDYFWINGINEKNIAHKKIDFGLNSILAHKGCI